MIARIREVSEGWFGFPYDREDVERGSFKGATPPGSYSEGAHSCIFEGNAVLRTDRSDNRTGSNAPFFVASSLRVIDPGQQVHLVENDLQQDGHQAGKAKTGEYIPESP
jgi:hypothetical protein